MYGSIPSICWLIIFIWLGVQARWFGVKQWTSSRQNGGLWWDWLLQHTLMEDHGKIHNAGTCTVKYHNKHSASLTKIMDDPSDSYLFIGGGGADKKHYDLLETK